MEWLPVIGEVGSAAGLTAMLAWLVWAITQGKLVSGSEARRLAEAQASEITRLSSQNQALLEAALLSTRVVDALPPHTEEDS